MHTYTFTRGQLLLVLNDAISLFLEYRDQHGKVEAEAQAAAVAHLLEGLDRGAIEKRPLMEIEADLATREYFTREEAEGKVGHSVQNLIEALDDIPRGTTGTVVEAEQATEEGWSVIVEWDLPFRVQDNFSAADYRQDLEEL